MRKLGKIMGIFTNLVITPVLSAFVFTKLWMWFIVPIISVPPLSIPAALGIIILVNFFRKVNKKDIKKSSKEDKFWNSFSPEYTTFKLLVPILSLIMGWVVTLFL